MSRWFATVCCCALLLACGWDEVITAVSDAGTEPPNGFPFDNASAFDHSDCQTTGPLDAVELDGIWHMELTFDDGIFPAPIRFDPSQLNSGYLALLIGASTDDVQVSATDVFVRRQWAAGGGVQRIRAWDACEVVEEGVLAGQYATCSNEDCLFATFTAWKVDPIEEPVASGLTLLSEFTGAAADPWLEDTVTLNVRHYQDIVLLARGSEGLRIIDVSDPANPVARGHALPEYLGAESYNDLKVVVGNNSVPYVLMASSVLGVVVYDISDPDNPTQVSTFPTTDTGVISVNVHTLFIENQRAYIANIDMAGIEIFDVSNPASPVRLGGYIHTDISSLGGFVHDLYVEGGRVYLNYWNRGMVVIDTQADPANPTLVGVFDSYNRRTSHSAWATSAGGRKIAVHGDEDIGAHVRIVDVDPASAEFMSEIGDFETRPFVSVHNIMVVGERALVTYYQDGLRILDLSDPTQPVEIAHFASWPGAEDGYGENFFEAAIGVDYNPVTGHIYLADTHRGLFVLNPDTPLQ